MNRDRRDNKRLAAVTLFLAGGAVACGVAYGNPTAPQVVNGQASFVTQGNTLTVNNTPGTIINWQSFSNAADEVTRFVQQSSTSSVLNRVVGVDPSTILGTIQSNGRVFLINPNGILFGPNSRIDVNGLIASTLPLGNADFLAGRFSATAGPVSGAIRNQGAITTPAGGKVWLIAPEVENSGIITAPEGDVLLAAGRSVHLVDSTTPDIAVVISAPEDKALNLGRIVADSGKVGIYGGLVSQKGVVSADSAVVGKDGRIFFRSTHGTSLDAGSLTTANGARGGEITVSATEGTTNVSGTVSATGSKSSGGSVAILGTGVSLRDGAQVDVSGASGGGTLLVGGDFQGKNPAVQHALTAFVAKNALLRADAGTIGDGGKIIVWSDGITRTYGTLSARGGSLSGNGGLIETSGHFLSVTGSTVDAAAPRGLAGTWLLDPLNIEITGTSLNSSIISGSPAAGTDTIEPNDLGTPSQINATDIITRLEAGTNIIITTNVAVGSEAGHITISAPITKSGASPAATLLLDAVGDIILNQSIINTSSTPLDVTLTAGGAISSAGGTVELSYGGLTANAQTGISLSGNVSTFSAANGASGGITFTNSGALTVNNITQNSSTPILITSNGDMNLGSINAAGGGVVTLRSHNGSILDFNSVSPNISGAFRVDFNDGSTTTPGSVGTNLDAIEVQNLGLGGITAQAGSGGINITNTAGSLKLGGISYNGTGGDVLITSLTDTTITGALGSFSGHTGNMTVDVTNGSLTIDAAVNKGGGGTLLLRAAGASGDVNVNSNILGNGNGVSIQAGRDILFNGRDTGAGIVDNLVNGTALTLSSNGNIFGALAQLSTAGATSISSAAGATVSLTNVGNSLSGTISVAGGNNVSVTTSGNMIIGPTTQAGILSLQSVAGSISGSSTLAGSQVNATAAAGINLSGPNTAVTVNLANSTSGNVFYSSSVGNAMTLTVTGSNNGAGGTFSVNESTGDLRVGAGGISTANGQVMLNSQKPDGTLLVAGPVDAGTGNVDLSGFNLAVQGDVSGNAVRLKAHGAGTGTLSTSGTPLVVAGSVLDLLADNMSFSGGQFIFSNANPTNTISIRSMSDDRPITIGTACTMPGCLLLSNLSDGLFSTPRLRIGNDFAADPNTAGNIDVAAPINRSGMLSLLTAGSITQSAAATIGVNSLGLSGASVDLRQANPVGVVAGRATSGDFLYRSLNQLTLSPVDMFTGITAAGSVWLESDSSSGINQIMGSSVSTPGTLVLNTIGPVNLMDGGNNVGTLAADLFRSGTGGGGLQFSNGPNALIINSGLGISGIRTNNQPIMVMAGGTPANGLFIRNAVNGGTSFVSLVGPSVFLDSGSTVAGGSVRLSAIAPTGGGFIAASGPTAPVVQALKSIELEADNLSFSINPTFVVSNADVRNEISIMNHTSGRPITVGTACAFGGSCLLLSNVSTTLFNAPTLVIGSEDMLPTTSTKPPIVAGDISITSAITRAGRLALLTGGSINQAAPISVDAMAVVAAGAVNLAASNTVGQLAALTDGPFTFTTTGALEIVSVVGGIQDPVTIEGIDSLGNITLTSGGNLTLSAPIDAGNQTVTMNAGGAIIDAVDDSLYSASIYAGDLDFIAANGIGSLTTPLAVDVATLIAENNGSGDVVIENAGALEVLDVNNAGGAVELAAFTGNLNLSGPVFAATDVFLAAEAGAIIDSNGGATSVEADSLDAYAATGIGSATAPLVTAVSLLSATSEAGNVFIENTGAVTIGSLSTGGTGSISLENAGAVTTGASTIQAPGTVTVIARSPLTIGSGGVSAGGNILLEAGASGSGDTMAVAGKVISSGGSIDLRAGDTVTITGTVSAPAGTATKTEKLNTLTPVTTDLQAPPPPSAQTLTTVQSAVDQVVKETTQIVPQSSTTSPTTTSVAVLTTQGSTGTTTDSTGTGSSGSTSSDTTSGTTSSDSSTSGTADSSTTTSSDSTDGGSADSTTGGTSDEMAESSDNEEDEKKDAEKKQDKGQSGGEKKDDAPKKKQYCN